MDLDLRSRLSPHGGVTLNRGGSWLGYWGHRTDKGKAPNQADAMSWLTRVDVAEARKAREEARRRADRDKVFDDKRAERGRDWTPKYEQPTEAQSKAFAQKLAANVKRGMAEQKARDEWETTAATPEEHAEAAARLRKVLGT
jgi:hypothetical protein